jgi:hypothetical protein
LEHLTCSISVVIVDWNDGTVDWELLKIWAAIPIQLSIEIGEDSSLKQRILGEINSANDMTGLELLDSQLSPIPYNGAIP